MEFFNDLWVPGIPILEKVIRSILVYTFLLAALRLGGKRELGQMNGFDLVVLLLLSNTVQNAIIGNDNSVLGGFVGAATLLGVNYMVVRLAYRYPRVLRLVEGKSTILVSNGRIIPEHLSAEVITEAELRASLRRQGFEEMTEVKAAILETNGSLTVERQPLTSADIEQQRLAEQLTRIETTLKRLTEAAS
ncbi:DUF421 domain-containing protein [Oculatella sp. LEGE 06141]|uniref:DUF421 domain-containing protein n=1 Tax=Oculatella sp. LEGE 06141 TaxID=1828648 RepID=UPI00187DE9EE|nr:YetF domain-containing protein [Oculatella sp. LEGE 06141]MBE9180704.1 DUF421 domain-containing protein [Oculatella sp. LEGE 06141]